MILAPRPGALRPRCHPASAAGYSVVAAFPVARENRSLAAVLLVDSIGELAALYALADVAFVGGSLVPRGGHNIIEPAQHGVAIVPDNHTENFRDIVALFQTHDAVRIVAVAELPLTLMQLLADDSERRTSGDRAQETMRSQVGATQRTLAALQIVGDKAAIRLRSRRRLRTPIESPLIHLRRRVGSANALYDRGFRASRLQGPVVSVGNLSAVGQARLRSFCFSAVAQVARNQVRCSVARLWSRVARRRAG